jgi:hypothetical protein
VQRSQILAVALAFASPALADTPIPMIDMEPQCADYARRMNGGEEMRQTCLKAQQENFYTLAAMWRTTPEAVRRTCSDKGPKNWGELGSCVVTETAKFKSEK